MIKLGVHRLEDFRADETAGMWSGLRRLVSGNRISLRLLRTQVPPSPREIAVFEHISKEMRLASGIYRRTFRHRFREMDPVVNALLRERGRNREIYEVEDWAASTCLTSTEWAETLFDALPQSRLTASDLTLNLLEIATASGGVYIAETNGKPLQYLEGKFTLRLEPPERMAVLLNWWLARRALGRWPEIWRTLSAQADRLNALGSDNPTFETEGLRVSTLPIVHPEAEALRQSDGRFRIERHSVFEPRAAAVDAIRTMNIFNLAYFQREKLTEGISAVWRSLRPGGIWIVGRTVSENPLENNFSVLEKNERGFDLLKRDSRGSEIEALALELDLAGVARECN